MNCGFQVTCNFEIGTVGQKIFLFELKFLHMDNREIFGRIWNSLSKSELAAAVVKWINHLRNEFNFWNVHGIMNTLGLLQS